MDKESIMGECLIIRSGGGTDTSDATATSDVVLSGYTCYVNDELVTGSMVAQNPGNQSLTPGGEYTIKEGYYDGTDEISVTSLSDNTSANATAGYILTGYNAWVNGSNVSGSMANQGNVSQSLAANGSYTIPAGWHAGAGVVNQSLATQGAVNVTPGTANKTACAANHWTTGNIVIAGSGNLTAGNIKNGITIFGIRGTFQGWVDNTSSWSSTTRVVLEDYEPSDDDYNAAGFCWRAASNITRNWNYIWIDMIYRLRESYSDWGTTTITSYSDVEGASWIWFGTDGANSNKFVAFNAYRDNNDYSFHIAAGRGYNHVTRYDYNWEYVSYDRSSSFISGTRSRVGDWTWTGDGGRNYYGVYQYDVQYKVDINQTVGSLKLNGTSVNTVCVTVVTGDHYRFSNGFSMSQCNVRFSKS